MRRDCTRIESLASAKEKETKIDAAESLSNLEADSASSVAAGRPGSIWTIIGRVICKLRIFGRELNMLTTEKALANFSDGYQQSLVGHLNPQSRKRFNQILRPHQPM
jgi:hypothetical protein